MARKNSKEWALDLFRAEQLRVSNSVEAKAKWSQAHMLEEVTRDQARANSHKDSTGKLLGFWIETKPSYRKRFSRCAYVTIPECTVEPDDATSRTRREHIREGKACYIGDREDWLVFNPRRNYHRFGSSIQHKCMGETTYKSTEFACGWCWQLCEVQDAKHAETRRCHNCGAIRYDDHHIFCRQEMDRLQLPNERRIIQRCSLCGTVVEGGLMMMAMLHFAEL